MRRRKRDFVAFEPLVKQRERGTTHDARSIFVQPIYACREIIRATSNVKLVAVGFDELERIEARDEKARVRVAPAAAIENGDAA